MKAAAMTLSAVPDYAARYGRFAPEELDRQYNARATVDDAGLFLADYARESAAARAAVAGQLGVPYGEHPDETIDVFPAAKPGSPIFFFIHGGYWRALSKDDSSFMAPAFVAAGATVVAVNYSLAPEASLDRIVEQCRRALAFVHREAARFNGDAARIHVSGSSAGGHLTGMMLAGGWHADFGVPPSVVHSASPISGIFDLRPLLHTHINAWAKLDEAAALRLSPEFHLPAQGGEIVVSCGAMETEEFVRQSHDYLAAWQARGFPGRFVAMPGTNHFDIIMSFRNPASPLTRAIFEAMELAPRA